MGPAGTPSVPTPAGAALPRPVSRRLLRISQYGELLGTAQHVAAPRDAAPPLRAALRGRRSPRGTRGAHSAGPTPPCATEADRGAAISQTTAAYGTTRRRSRRGPGAEEGENGRKRNGWRPCPPRALTQPGEARPAARLRFPSWLFRTTCLPQPPAPGRTLPAPGLGPAASSRSRCRSGGCRGWVEEKGAAPEVLLHPYAWEMPAPLLGAVPCSASPAVRPPCSVGRSHPHFSGRGISDHQHQVCSSFASSPACFIFGWPLLESQSH